MGLIMNLKISIIVPAYNLEKYISKTLDSLRKQTFDNFEVYIIDDASTDKTVEHVKKFCEIDKRFNLIKLSQNGGISHARNVGIQVAKGDYIIFVDGDDSLSKDALKRLNNEISVSNEKIDAVYFNLKVVSDGDNAVTIREKRYGKDRVKDGILDTKQALQALFSNKIKHTTPTYLFSLDILKNNDISFPEDRDYGEDFATIYRILAKSKNVKVISDRLYLYTQRMGSATHTYNIKYAQDNLKTVREIESFLKKNSQFHFLENNKDLYLIPRLITSLSIVSKIKNKNTEEFTLTKDIEKMINKRAILFLSKKYSLEVKFKIFLNKIHLLKYVFYFKR
jgi:glycosyltransferase involved in cell wall biosynthesis